MAERHPIHALLIGIDDYSKYDSSAGNAAGTSDLRGAVNDVHLFASALAKLGVPSSQVKVMTAGRASKAGELASAGAPTKAAIESALDALASTLVEKEGRGVVLFCGHGDSDARGPLLCPSDVTNGLSEALSFSDVAGRLDKRGQRTDVSFLLDACHAAPREDRRSDIRRRALRGRTEAVAAPRRLRRDDDVVLAASGADDPSYEYELHGKWQGAFTWTITSLLDRWGKSPNGDAFAITWADLVRRAGHILRELDVDQQPHFTGPRNELRHHVLGGRATRAGSGPAAESLTREVPGGIDGYILGTTAGTIGIIDIMTSTIDWKWINSTAAWPTNFTLKKTGSPPTNTPYVVTTDRAFFPANPSTYSVTGVKYKIKQNGVAVGYMHPLSTQLIFYSINAGAEFAVADMEFQQNTDTGFRTLYRVSDMIL